MSPAEPEQLPLSRPPCPACGQPWISNTFLLELTVKAQAARARMKLCIPTAVDEALKATAQAMRCRMGICRREQRA